MPTRNESPTLRDVCRISGVSKATVSRVINSHSSVSERTRERVLHVMNSLGYSPNAAARSLSRQKTELIGLVLPDISGGFYATIIKGVDNYVRSRGYHLIVSFTHEEDNEFDAGAALLGERRIDGLIALQPLAKRQLCRKLEQLAMPTVLLQKPAEGSQLPFVSIDNVQGGQDMATHLLQCGYRKILVVAGPLNSEDSRDRLEGCRSAFVEHHVELENLQIIYTGFTPEDAIPKVMERLDRHPSLRPDAIFAFNDDIALGLYKALTERGIRVPEDMGLAGFDGIDAGDFAGLTTLKTPLLEMGTAAGNIVVDLIEKKMVAKRKVILDGHVVIRNSTRAKKKSALSANKRGARKLGTA